MSERTRRFRLGPFWFWWGNYTPTDKDERRRELTVSTRRRHLMIMLVPKGHEGRR